MTSRDSLRGRQRAEFHEARARNYRRQAGLLLERDSDADSASALLYESAKQCINAVANLHGTNPGTTGAKMNALRAISEQEPDDLNLVDNWNAATELHVHADRGNLIGSEFAEMWQQAQDFIDAMLAIYERDE